MLVNKDLTFKINVSPRGHQHLTVFWVPGSALAKDEAVKTEVIHIASQVWLADRQAISTRSFIKSKPALCNQSKLGKWIREGWWGTKNQSQSSLALSSTIENSPCLSLYTITPVEGDVTLTRWESENFLSWGETEGVPKLRGIEGSARYLVTVVTVL